MNNHQVIARKWRPQKFGDVVGQLHVIRTLRNAVANNRIGHAYLLVGPRGIGKTTIARIFAKSINCERPVDGEPCCECSSCRAIAEESSLDVIEIDAASRNSVDHMRALSEEACHMPVASKYKIYIIDEVHMLSKAAWNALLKTVEEPPAHVKFIFATTEAHLVLPTIVSRCQRFDLRPIPGNLILERLKLIAEAEDVKIAPEALSAIARAAEGGMRDAQSSLEQMLAFFGGRDREIEAEQVLELFGLTNAAELDTLLAAMLQNQPAPVITTVNTLAARGRNLETLFDDILEMLRGAELMRLLPNPEQVLDFDPEKLNRCRNLAALANPAVLRSFMESLTPVGRILHEALNKAIYLESILLKAMSEAHAPTIGDVLHRLNQLRGAGELQFIEQIPSFQAQPVVIPPLPAPAPTAAPVAAQVIETPSIPAETPVQTAKPEPVAAAVPEPAPEPVIETPAAVIAAPPEAAAEPEAIGEAVPAAETAAEPEQAIEEVPAAEAVAEPEAVVAEVPAVEVTEVEVPAENKLANLWNDFQVECNNAGLSDLIAGCEVQSYINSVLTMQVPAHKLGDLREQRMQLLQILQKISGDWAILLDLQTFAPAETPAETVEDIPAETEVPAQEDIPAMTSAPETVAQETPPTAQEPVAEQLNSAPEMSYSEFDGDNYEQSESSFEMIGEVDDSVVVEYVEKRSLIDKPEEIEATAAMKPVKMVIDLFDGEIVDIHA